LCSQRHLCDHICNAVKFSHEHRIHFHAVNFHQSEILVDADGLGSTFSLHVVDHDSLKNEGTCVQDNHHVFKQGCDQGDHDELFVSSARSTSQRSAPADLGGALPQTVDANLGLTVRDELPALGVAHIVDADALFIGLASPFDKCNISSSSSLLYSFDSHACVPYTLSNDMFWSPSSLSFIFS